MGKEEIKFYIGKGGIAPTRNKGDAGFDFYIPEDWYPCGDPAFSWGQLGSIFLRSGEGILINTKIRSKIPSGQALIAFNKSGIATKKHLQVGACVVDSSYQGEIHIHVFNWGKQIISLEAKDKLVQFVPIQINDGCNEAIYEEEMSIEEFYGSPSQRGSKGFGSTGDKV